MFISRYKSTDFCIHEAICAKWTIDFDMLRALLRALREALNSKALCCVGAHKISLDRALFVLFFTTMYAYMLRSWLCRWLPLVDRHGEYQTCMPKNSSPHFLFQVCSLSRVPLCKEEKVTARRTFCHCHDAR